MKNHKNGVVVDSLILTLVRVITALISIIMAKLLAVYFTTDEYAIYSQAMLIATTGSSVIILGLTDATNYFFNRENSTQRRDSYIATIFIVQILLGVILAVCVCVFSHQIAVYFNNPEIVGVIPYVAFMPLFTNLMNMLQILFVSAKKAKVLALRNFIISIIKVSYVIVVCLFVKDIKYILMCLFFVELLTTVYMFVFVHKKVCKFEFSNFSTKLIKSIFVYSIPMAGYIVTNSLSRSMDKLVIARLADTSSYAVYSMVSKELPFDMLTAAFVTVLIPYITRYVNFEDYASAAAAFSRYIQISYLITWPIGVAAIINCNDLLVFLYDDKYASGIIVFVIYIIVDMIRFANVSLVFSAKARTKELLVYSCSALIANVFLNILLYKLFGIIGPAIATVIVMFVVNSIMIVRSSKLINAHVFDIINLKQMIILICELICFSLIFRYLNILLFRGFPIIIRLGFSCLMFIGVIILLNRKALFENLRKLNSVEM